MRALQSVRCRFPSAAPIAYIPGTQTFDLITKQQVAAISANGKLFEWRAGPVSAAFGAEYRKKSIAATSDPLSQANQWQSGARLPTASARQVNKWAGE
jgi:iron complex outermembrane receptor protein